MKVVYFDPGESTGYAVFADSELADAGTCELWEAIHALAGALLGLKQEECVPELLKLFRGASKVVMEDWSLYPWELQNLAWDKCRTARGIGAMEAICRLADVPYKLQPAKIKETAVAAGAEDLFLHPLHENRHANDAIMHGVVDSLGLKVAGAEGTSELV